MKAFEEWYEEEIKDKGKDYWLPWPSAAKMGWKAALEWILNNDDAYCCGDCDDDGWHECSTKIAIEKELKGLH